VNWLIGVMMLLPQLGANFTAICFPWDQLAVLAITVGNEHYSHMCR